MHGSVQTGGVEASWLSAKVHLADHCGQRLEQVREDRLRMIERHNIAFQCLVLFMVAQTNRQGR